MCEFCVQWSKEQELSQSDDVQVLNAVECVELLEGLLCAVVDEGVGDARVGEESEGG